MLEAETEQEPADTSQGPVAAPQGANIQMRISEPANRPDEEPRGSSKGAAGDASDAGQSAGKPLQVFAGGGLAARQQQHGKTPCSDTQSRVCHKGLESKTFPQGKNFSKHRQIEMFGRT